jgi:hypothetical protein
MKLGRKRTRFDIYLDSAAIAAIAHAVCFSKSSACD